MIEKIIGIGRRENEKVYRIPKNGYTSNRKQEWNVDISIKVRRRFL